MARKETTQTETATATMPAHHSQGVAQDELTRLRGMADDLRQRIEQLQLQARDTSNNVQVMLDAQREAAIVQATITQVEASIYRAEITELQAKWQEHEVAAQAHAKHAANLQSLFAEERELCSRYIAETRIVGSESDEEIEALVKAFGRFAKAARDMALENQAMMMHITQGNVVKEEIRLRQRRQ